MLITLTDISKKLGAKLLYKNLSLTIQPSEKVGLIGRNGVGKTTLFGIMSEADKDFDGRIDRRRGLSVIATAQEHLNAGSEPVLEYILGELPEYAGLKRQLEDLPATMGQDLAKITTYTEALERFGKLGYHDIEETVLTELLAYGLDRDLAAGPLARLSGGQKRFVELTKVTVAHADLALIDEPTNHMDYVAKAAFIDWLRVTAMAVVVITHDRDVLQTVDRILELKESGITSYKGNYEAYLSQNSVSTTREIATYEQAQKRLVKIDKQIAVARSKKAGWSGTADKTNPFMLLERRLQQEKDELLAQMKRPDFWIDQESIDQLPDKVVDRYDRYKAKNIRLGMEGQHRYRQLIKVDRLTLGYGQPLFQAISLELAVGQRLRLHGRNGAGKSTLIRHLLAVAADQPSAASVYGGELVIDPRTVIGVYEQEIEARYLDVALGAAIGRVYREQDRPVSDQVVRQVLSQYLFDPRQDISLPIGRLSGGQKARFQLITMLAAEPNLLILDEPTNHLDLPSIEELEKALAGYQGAVLYVSHDSYFAEAVGGEMVVIGAAAIAAAA